MMKQQLSITFFLRKCRKTKIGLIPIHVRVVLNQNTKRFSTGQNVNLLDWDQNNQRVREKATMFKSVNTSLEAIHNRLTKSYFKVMNMEVFDLNDLLAEYSGKPMKKPITLLELIEKHNQDFAKRIGIDRAASTYEKYTITEMRIKGFLKDDQHKKDINLSSLRISFIKEFSIYLQREFSNKQNTVAKNVKNLKHIIAVGIELGWIDKNPFFGFKYSYKETPQVILTQAELDKIENKVFLMPRLELVKNLFIFQCYTGLSYVDMVKLTASNIVKGNDEGDWLILNRTKSEMPVRMPLLSRARAVIDLYKNDETLRLFPVYANQKMNSYLKEIATICEINKNLTTHVGRRTFATTVCLSNGIPIETVSKLLGHSNLIITQLYAKVVDKKISDEMNGLEKLLTKRVKI